ncbi:MAG: hypothetical protein AAF696_15755, partial [Bacteroidota bacterium]
MMIIAKTQTCSILLYSLLSLLCCSCFQAQGQSTQTIDFRNYEVDQLNNATDWIQTVFRLPSSRMEGGEDGVKLSIDVNDPGPYNYTYRSELREQNINTFPQTNTSQVYRMKFRVDELPDLFGPITIFQRFNRDNDGPDIEVELTGKNQFSNAVANDLQVVAFNRPRQRLGKFLKEVNDLMIVIYTSSNGKYKISLNGETLSQAEGINTLPATDGTWTQFGIYPHGLHSDRNRQDQRNSGNTKVSFTYESYAKTVYEYEVNLDDFNTTDPSNGNGGPDPGPNPTDPVQDTCSGNQPQDWQFGNLGSPAIDGEVCENNNSFDMRASGEDIWNTSDEGYFMHQRASGDIEMQTRITEIGNSHFWAKGGIMIRESLDAGSRNALMCLTHQNRWSFQRRILDNDSTRSTRSEANQIALPYFVKLSRIGNWFYGYYSADGNSWNLADSVEIEMSAEVYIGFASTSHDAALRNTFLFDQISWKVPDGNGGNTSNCNPPSGWASSDLGNVGLAGQACVENDEIHVSASGSDIWSNEDQFFYIYQPLLGNWEVSTRILDIENTDPWAKAGLMIREGLTADAKNAFIASTAGGRWSFQRRLSNGGTTEGTLDESVNFSFPHWLKLKRTNRLFEGFYSLDGQNWELIGSVEIDMPEEILLGFAASSHDNSQLNLSKLDLLTFEDNNGSSGTFPVEFTDFYARPNITKNEIELIWEIAREQGNDFFSIERSDDGLIYQAIGQLDSQGDTEDFRSYNFTDLDPKEGNSYYRIKQIDLDGGFSYSQDLAVSFQPDDRNSIQVYPVPARMGEAIQVAIKWEEADLPLLEL